MRILIAAAIVCVALPAAAQDLDRDGLDDAFEQALLQRFVPTLLLSRGECDGRPASFAADRPDPEVAVQDGTLYGHAFALSADEGRPRVELQFFHLWARDCGRIGHALDAEHVSAIVTAPRIDTPAGAWVADVWYAAAHQNSVCDASSGAPARVLHAESSGPRVFVSRGKHASYFDRGQCKWGCGGDECSDDVAMPAAAVVNIGEIGAPLNGAAWIGSRRWRLSEKLASDFDPDRRARLESPRLTHVAPLMQHLRASQSPLLAGDTALDGLTTAADSTAQAIGAAARSVGAATRAVRSFLGRTRR